MKTVQYRYRYNLAVFRLFFFQLRIWIWDAIDPLIKAAMIVPGNEFGQGSFKMPSVNNDHMIQALAALCPKTAFTVCIRIRCRIWNGYSLDAHDLLKPEVKTAAIRILSFCFLIENGYPVLPVDAIVIVDQESGTFSPGCGISNLLFNPRKARMFTHSKMHNLSARKFHDNEDIDGNTLVQNIN